MSSVETSERQRLAQIVQTESIKRGDFVLASGRRSSYYLDCRRTTLHPEGAYLVGRLTFEAIRQESWNPHAVGGLTLGADPMATATSLISFQAGDPWAAFIVRKESKQHGTGQRIEGCPAPGARVVILEDVITSGGSASIAHDACVEAGLVVVGCVAIVDREEGGRAAIEARGVPVRALFTATELLG
jgi:orotate phosphoribosyltransferase